MKVPAEEVKVKCCNSLTDCRMAGYYWEIILYKDDKRHLELSKTCDLMPVADDMALCHPSLQRDDQNYGWKMRKMAGLSV
jgi:hypothetical protein